MLFTLPLRNNTSEAGEDEEPGWTYKSILFKNEKMGKQATRTSSFVPLQGDLRDGLRIYVICTTKVSDFIG
jgi:hypothetical protein